MQNKFDEVDGLVQSLKDLMPIKKEYQERLNKKFRLEFNYNSNHLEGNTLTYGETELLLIMGDTTGNHSLREYEEMKGHDIAIKLVEDWASDKERPLTEGDIRSLNKVILKEPFWKEAITSDGQNTRKLIKIGDYKALPNTVRLQSGEIFEYASPGDTPIAMQELIDWYRAQEAGLHPVTLAAMLHYKFVRIHPFDDGNGRIARLLINYVFLRNNLPPVVIKSADKQNYLRALHLADVGDYEPFINYIAEQLIWSLQIFIKAANGESIEEVGDLDKEIELLNKRLSGREIVGSAKTPELIYLLLKESLMPLFMSIEEKCEKLKNLFVDSSRHFSYRLDGGSQQTVESTDSKWKVSKIDWLEGKIKDIEYRYDFNGLKSSLTHQYFGISLTFIFDEFTYTMKTSNGGTRTFSYAKQLSQIEIDKIVSSLITDLLDRIKRAANIT